MCFLFLLSKNKEGDSISATNRGSKRNECDFYPTPYDTIDNFLSKVDLSEYGKEVLEPGAGNGNICRKMKEYYPDKHLTAIELRQTEENELNKCSDSVVIGDFLEIDINKKYDIIIGNPPFNAAIEFVKKSLSLLNENGVLIFLLRTSFLESKARFDFWQEYPVNDLYTLHKRPSFTGKGTDATSYSWFVWRKNSNKQTIKVI